MFRVIPAVDIKNGKVVQLQQGDEKKIIIELDDPVSIAKKWVEMGAKTLHVIDLDGAFEGRLKNEKIIMKIKELEVELQVGGGIRDLKIAERLIEEGIDRIIFGTLAMERSDEVREFIKENPKRVMIAIDSKKGFVTYRGWKSVSCVKTIEFAKLYDGLDVSFLYTDVDVEGMMKGIILERVREVVTSLKNPVFIAGGISSVEDIKIIKDCGASGVIIGSALYTGRIDLKKALELED